LKSLAKWLVVLILTPDFRLLEQLRIVKPMFKPIAFAWPEMTGEIASYIGYDVDLLNV